MVIDHIGLYFESMPMWLRFIGRASFLLFLFCMVWGYHYTKNRKKYLLRLYLMGLFMTSFGYVINKSLVSENGYVNHNIFILMLIVGVLISTIETFNKDRRKGTIMLSAIFGVQLLYYVLPYILPFVKNISSDVLSDIIPNLALNQYGLEFVALGVVMYFLKDRKDLLCAFYVLFCIGQFSTEMLEYGMIAQSFMILALPLMLCYNNQKGHSMKYLFYIFYPAHTFVLFYLANFVFGETTLL